MNFLKTEWIYQHVCEWSDGRKEIVNGFKVGFVDGDLPIFNSMSGWEMGRDFGFGEKRKSFLKAWSLLIIRITGSFNKIMKNISTAKKKLNSKILLNSEGYEWNRTQ